MTIAGMTTPHPLVAHSIAVIRANQAASGAYVASPSFGQYQACWFRDGSFIAHAMSVMGEADSASRFHDWAANVVLRHAGAARDCIARARAGQPLDPKRILNARYSLEGEDQGDDWPNFQLDGSGTWLWASIDHATRAGDTAAAARWRPAWDVVADYLGALWPLPCFDAWEEHGDQVHITTLAALFGGLNTYAAAAGSTEAARAAADIRAFVLTEGVQDGRLRKFAGLDSGVDAALLGATMPYGLLRVDDPIARATVAKIERDLRGGGVHRYATDTYYGGGEWILLTAWLGWHYGAAGQPDQAAACLAWIERQANPNLDLAEQVHVNLIAPEKLPEWQARWGPVATPLLWSHAQYLILWKALNTL